MVLIKPYIQKFYYLQSIYPGGWEAKRGLYHPLEMGTELMCLRQSTETATIHVLGQDGRGQQFDTCRLISTHHCIPHSAIVEHHEFTGSAKCCL